MRLFAFILAALLYFPTIASAELGPETNKLIRSFSVADELLYNGVIGEECYPLGFDFDSHDEILKQQLRLRRIKPIHYLDGDIGRLQLNTFTLCPIEGIATIQAYLRVVLSDSSNDHIIIGWDIGHVNQNYSTDDINRELKNLIDEKLSEFIGAWMEVEDLGSQHSVNQF